jgi:ADP-ribose pyrophosphatase YjhB (NUDIX family)
VFFDDVKEFSCRACSFTYYHNVAAAVGAILEFDGKIVLIRRGKEPGKGKLDLPGGFVDPKETAEEAIRREIREELGIDIGTLKYFGSGPNLYEYEGVAYHTCDLFFYSRIDSVPTNLDRAEVQELVLMESREVPLGEIAFPSVRACLSRFSAGAMGDDAV